MRAVLIALLISVVANILLTLGYLAQRDARGAAVNQLKNAQDAAQTCSQEVDRLDKLANSRRIVADKARAEARRLAKTHEQAADLLLSTSASVPGDDCKSASHRASAWLEGRSK